MNATTSHDTVEMLSQADGTAIKVHRWLVPAPRGGVVISHGAAEHALRYARFARVLGAAGLSVWAADHRGHGQSAGPGGLGDFGEAGWAGLLSDLRQVLSLAGEALGGAPLALFGHSMGSFAAQQLLPQAPESIGAVVLSGSTAIVVQPRGERVSAPGFNAAFEPARTPYDWLSRDPAEVDAYIADPLCGFEARRAGGGRSARPDYATLARDDLFEGTRSRLPVLLLSGERDPIHRDMEGLRTLEQRLASAGVSRVDTRYFEGGRHEMLNELDRDQVMAEARDWMLDALALPLDAQ